MEHTTHSGVQDVAILVVSQGIPSGRVVLADVEAGPSLLEGRGLGVQLVGRRLVHYW